MKIFSTKNLLLLPFFVFFVFAWTGCRSDLEKIETGEAVWRRSEMKNYRMKLVLMKAGHQGPRGVFRITVKNGSAVKTEKISSEPIDAAGGIEEFDTVEKLLSSVKNYLRKDDADLLKINWDSRYGYPSELDLDRDFDVHDDELYFKISEFEPL